MCCARPRTCSRSPSTSPHAAAREIRCVWTLWQTCLNTLGSTFLREEPGDAFAQGLYHVYDGDYIEEFDRRGSEDLVPAMFAELQAVSVSTWTARTDGSASQLPGGVASLRRSFISRLVMKSPCPEQQEPEKLTLGKRSVMHSILSEMRPQRSCSHSGSMEGRSRLKREPNLVVTPLTRIPIREAAR